jgi:putative addiction module CopG family antidote
MRQTLSISIPPALKKEIDQIVESGLYASASELIRDAVRDLKEKAIIKELRASQRDARAGRIYKLTSFRALKD